MVRRQCGLYNHWWFGIARSSFSSGWFKLCVNINRLTVTLFVSSLDGINLRGCPGGEDLHQNLLFRSQSLQVRKTPDLTWSTTCSSPPHLFLFMRFGNYLNGVTERFDIVHDRWGHQSNNQGLKFAAELRLQSINQILHWHRRLGQVWQ